MTFANCFPVAILAALASPAAAAGGAPIPEASSMLLFVLGAAGVLIGRSLSRGHRD